MDNRKKRKPTLKQRLTIYKKRFAKLDKATKLQILAIVAVVIIIIGVAAGAILGKGKKPNSEIGQDLSGSGAYDDSIDNEYVQDEYIEAMKAYEDVMLEVNTEADSSYFRDTLFIGDSNTEGLATYGHLGLQQVIGVTSMGIQAVQDKTCVWFVGSDQPVTIPKAVSMLKPRRIIINFGTNNTYGMETKSFINYYVASLNAIKKAYPYSDIIVASVLPVGKKRNNTQITMQTIDEFNLALAEMCKDEGYKFLNTSEVFRDSKTGFIKEDYVVSDGIHLSSAGFKALLEYVGSHKYITEDTRPARGTIPTRRNPPFTDENVSSTTVSVASISKSMGQSSSRLHSSSKFTSSSSWASSSKVPSSSTGSSSSVGSSSNAGSSSLGQSSSTGGSSSGTGTDSSTGGTDSSTGGTDSSTGGTDSSTGGTDSSTGGTDSSTGGTDSSTGGTDSSTGGTDSGTDSGTDGTNSSTDTDSSIDNGSNI